MFLTDEGWVEAINLQPNDVIVSLDGYSLVDSVIIENTTDAMYYLTVEEVHNFAVGEGDWVVHNCNNIKVSDLDPVHSPETSGERAELIALSNEELLQAIRNPQNDDPITINTNTGKIVDGNGRAYELIRRAEDPNSSITSNTEIPYEPYTPDNSMFWDM